MGKLFTISYFHHLVVRRNVRNPFEKNHVKHITNYLDVGFQIVNRRMLSQFMCSMVTAAMSWQDNKNWLVKVRADFASVGVCKWIKPIFFFTFSVLAAGLE